MTRTGSPGGTLTSVRIGVLGPVDGPSGLSGVRLRGLLARLALDAGRPVSTAALVDGLWETRPRTPPTPCRRWCRGCAGWSRARLVVTEPGGYRLVVDPSTVDVMAFDALVAEARSASPGAAHSLLGDALALWRGPALSDVAELPFAGPAAARLDGRRADVVDERARLALRLGLVPDIEALGAQLAAAPLRETTAALLGRALHAAGRQADALAMLDRTIALLAEELGVDPGPRAGRSPDGGAAPGARRPPHRGAVELRGARRRRGAHPHAPAHRAPRHAHRPRRGGQDPAGTGGHVRARGPSRHLVDGRTPPRVVPRRPHTWSAGARRPPRAPAPAPSWPSWPRSPTPRSSRPRCWPPSASPSCTWAAPRCPSRSPGCWPPSTAATRSSCSTTASTSSPTSPRWPRPCSRPAPACACSPPAGSRWGCRARCCTPSTRSPRPTPCSSSPIGPPPCAPASRSTPPPGPPSPRSAAASTANRCPSSWPRPGCAPSRPRRSPPASTTGSACSPREPAPLSPPPNAAGGGRLELGAPHRAPSAAWPGASACSRAAPRSPRPSGCAGPRPGMRLRRWWTSRSSSPCRRPTGPPATACWRRSGPTRARSSTPRANARPPKPRTPRSSSISWRRPSRTSAAASSWLARAAARRGRRDRSGAAPHHRLGRAVAYRIAVAMTWSWLIRGRLDEGRRWLGALPPPGERGRSRTSRCSRGLPGDGRHRQRRHRGRPRRADGDHRRARHAAPSVAPGAGAGGAGHRGVRRAGRGPAPQARRHGRRPLDRALALQTRAVRAENDGDLAAQRELLRATHTAFSALGERFGLGMVLYSLGELENLAGEHDAAAATFDEAIALTAELGNDEDLHQFIAGRAMVDARRGEFEAARAPCSRRAVEPRRPDGSIACGEGAGRADGGRSRRGPRPPRARRRRPRGRSRPRSACPNARPTSPCCARRWSSRRAHRRRPGCCCRPPRSPPSPAATGPCSAWWPRWPPSSRTRRATTTPPSSCSPPPSCGGARSTTAAPRSSRCWPRWARTPKTASPPPRPARRRHHQRVPPRPAPSQTPRSARRRAGH